LKDNPVHRIKKGPKQNEPSDKTAIDTGLKKVLPEIDEDLNLCYVNNEEVRPEYRQ